MPLDLFKHSGNSLIAPATSAFAINPDDAATLPLATRAIYVGSGGSMVAQMIDGGEDITFENLSPGSVLAIRLRAVRGTGTTASSLIGLA